VDNGNASGRVGGRSIMFLYGEFSNQNFTIHTDTNYKNRQYITFSLDSSKTVNIKLASSFISINQAKKNLALEITNDNLNFETLQQRAANI
jgi:putative alpha-1,2-mannosidase